MVENVADDSFEPKLTKIEAYGVGVGSNDVKPNVDVNFKVKIPFQAHTGHNQQKPKPKPAGNRGICSGPAKRIFGPFT